MTKKRRDHRPYYSLHRFVIYHGPFRWPMWWGICIIVAAVALWDCRPRSGGPT